MKPRHRSLLAGALFAVSSLLTRADTITLEVDPAHSRIEYDVKATMDSFTGTLKTYECTLAADPGVPGGIARAVLRFRFEALDSGNEKRDRQMNAWQNSAQFPEASFTLTALEPAATAGRYTARGQFVLHGMTRELAFPVSIATDPAGLVVIDAEAPIDTRDFGLPIIRKFAVLKVDPVVIVRLHLQARPRAVDATIPAAKN